MVGRLVIAGMRSRRKDFGYLEIDRPGCWELVRDFDCTFQIHMVAFQELQFGEREEEQPLVRDFDCTIDVRMLALQELQDVGEREEEQAMGYEKQIEMLD